MPLTIRRAVAADPEPSWTSTAVSAPETEGKTLDPTVLTAGVKAGLADGNKARYFVAEEEGRIARPTDADAGMERLAQWLGVVDSERLRAARRAPSRRLPVALRPCHRPGPTRGERDRHKAVCRARQPRRPTDVSGPGAWKSCRTCCSERSPVWVRVFRRAAARYNGLCRHGRARSCPQSSKRFPH